VSKRTLELAPPPVLQVPTLRTTVVEGPDAGSEAVAHCETLSVGTAELNDLVLRDDTVSRFHLELQSVARGVLVVDHGSTNGTRVDAASVLRAVVPWGTVLNLGRSALRVGEGPNADIEMHDEESFGEVHGRSQVMRRLMARVKQAAKSDIAVLLVGESGTGKEVIARALHRQGLRADRPFITVDCGAVSPGLVTSELFGHERGAFTGAERPFAGAFERAHGGTLFLDEIGELAPELQTHLLGVLERRTFRRLGGSKDIATDVRVIAATNRDLRADVNSGKFRLDLYYRITVVSLQVPPLRERQEDIELLVRHFLDELGFSGTPDEVISPTSLAQLKSHHWPGNVRELRNLVEASIAMGEPIPIWGEGNTRSGRAASPETVGEGDMGEADMVPYKVARDQVVHNFEQTYLERLIETTGGNIAKASRVAKMNRSHLFRMLKKHNLR
jgi:DNA-binding NtrC family response regulator